MDIDALNDFLAIRGVTSDGTVFPVVHEPIAVDAHKYSALLALQQRLNAVFAHERDFSFVDAVRDPYVCRLRDIRASKTSPDAVSLTLMRSDYILDSALNYRQVEVNVFSVAFPAFAQVLAHEAHILDPAVVQSNALDLLADAMARAGDLFDSHYATSSLFVMLTQHNDKNTNDQLHVVRALAERGRRLVRIPLAHAPHALRFAGTRCLYGPEEVSLVYYRAGYRPDEYTEDIWALRRSIELSRCVKLPDIDRSLLNTKLYQRVFSTLPDIRPYACAFHDRLHPPCVVKPMREGGGNNVFVGVATAPTAAPPVTTRDCVIMDYIDPHCEHHTILGTTRPTVSELSTFGVHLSYCGTDVISSAAGYLIRTKPADAPEGSVTLGTAALAVMKFK